MKKPNYSVLIDLSHPESHRALVEIQARSEELPPILEFPVWTPGSYMIREYARHITRLDPAEKISKNKWRISNLKKVSYEVYGLERTVRTSFIDENYVSLVGATLLPLLHTAFEVEIRFPKNWKIFSSALPFKKVGPGRWRANIENDDRWIDCPIVAAAPGFGGVGKFKAKGITHHIAWVGMHNARQMKDFEDSFHKIVTHTVDMFGGAPFKEYWFLLHFGHKLYGGLEHRDSQLSQFDGASLVEQKEWDGFLRLIAHEYFHAWNVKSIRPFALGPFNYSSENYTQDIWFAEGITDYFDDIIPLRCGFIQEEGYWKSRVKDAANVNDGLPGHKRRSLAESSMDAWIRHYRGDEDSPNTDISYYAKGALLGWCWDAHLRKKSKGKWTLERLLRAIWKEFGVDASENLKQARPGFTREELLAFAEGVSRVKQAKEVESWVSERKALPWREAAKFFGLKISEKVSDPVLHLSGLALQWKGSQCTVGKVMAGSSAEMAGISPNDEIIALNGIRISDPEKLQLTWKKCLHAKGKMEILLARLDRTKIAHLAPKPHKGLGTEYIAHSVGRKGHKI